MSDNITLTGIVGSDPRVITTTEGLAITSFRLASSQRRFDRAKNKWVDGETNWYSVTTFRQLATNSAASVHRGDRVVVAGRVRITPWRSGERSGLNIDVEADAVGHDLTWGTAAYSRNSGLSVNGGEATDTADSSTDVAAGGPTGGGAHDPERGDAVVTELPNRALEDEFPTEAELANVETPF